MKTKDELIADYKSKVQDLNSQMKSLHIKIRDIKKLDTASIFDEQLNNAYEQLSHHNLLHQVYSKFVNELEDLQ